jgi:hypothetical protein
MHRDEEVKTMFKDWFIVLVGDFYDVRIKKLVTRYDRGLNLYRDSVVKVKLSL